MALQGKKLVAALGLLFTVGVLIGAGLSSYAEDKRGIAIVDTRDISTSGQVITDPKWGVEAPEDPLPRAASFMLDYGDGRVKVYRDVQFAAGESVLSALRALAEREGIAFETKEYQGLGALVTRIGDRTNGDEGKYWQYWVGNVAPPVGADAATLAPGDVIEWKFLRYSGQ